jgi:hypothetical protein
MWGHQPEEVLRRRAEREGELQLPLLWHSADMEW